MYITEPKESTEIVGRVLMRLFYRVSHTSEICVISSFSEIW